MPEQTHITRRGFMISATVASALAADAAPMPYGAVPSSRQLDWHELEFYGFLHFTINTFTDKEWGYGDEDPALFNPTAFDADAIIAELKSAGMAGVILTSKHHDGFCLWPTRTTEHSIRKSPWKNGRGDMVREFSRAARRHGMQFGVYLSPWDRNHPQYARPEYVGVYREQLRELLTGYGPIFEVWHDGANGGDGYYGGAREKRVIDKLTYYDWPKTWDLVRSLQPGAVIFSDVGPDVRWVGNESGYAGETCWATYDPTGPDGGPPAPGHTRYREGTTGHRNGSRWLPAECDVSIRRGWFWHERENSTVKSPARLFDLYCRSVGRGASFLLNVPPDRRGLLHETDVASLRALGDMLRKAFAENLAAKSKATASNVRGGDRRLGPRNLVDGDRYSYWSTDDQVKTPEAVFDLEREVRFDLVRLRENLRLGQRVEGFAIDVWNGSEWIECARGTSIGSCRIARLKAPVAASRVRLRITAAAACPALSEFGLYLGPTGITG